MKEIHEMALECRTLNRDLRVICQRELKKCAKELEILGMINESLGDYYPDEFEDDYTFDEYVNKYGIRYVNTDGCVCMGLDYKLNSDGLIVFTKYVCMAGKRDAKIADMKEDNDYYMIYANDACLAYDLLCEIHKKIDRFKDSK